MINKIVIYIISLFDYFHNKKIVEFLKKRKLTNLNLLFDIGAHKGESIKLFLNNLNIRDKKKRESMLLITKYLKHKTNQLHHFYLHKVIEFENLIGGWMFI